MKKRGTFSKVNIGKIKPNPVTSKKSVLRNDKRLKVVKLNGKTQYYSCEIGREKINNTIFKKILEMSVSGRKFVKEHPEVVNFLKEILYRKSNSSFFENKNIRLNLKKLNPSSGNIYENIFKMNIFLKDANKSNSYFVKISNHYTSNTEFIANQYFQKHGINTIKPHFSFSDQLKGRNIIVYDFTSMMTLRDSVANKKITEKQFLDIKKKISSLNDVKNIKIGTSRNRGVMDYMNLGNIFIKKNKDKIDVYFTDLFIGRGFQLWEK